MRKDFVLIFLLTVISSCDRVPPLRSAQARPGIFLSFDDYCVDEWFTLRDTLSAYGARVTFYISNFDTLSAAQIEKLRALEGDGHEIAFHGTHHLLAETYIRAHSLDDYLDFEITPGMRGMEKNGFAPTSFAYPYGSKYHGTDRALLKRFKTLRGVVPFRKDKSIPDDALYSFENERLLNAICIDRREGLTLSMVSDAISKCMDEKKVLVLYGHEPETHFDVTLLASILRLAQEENLEFFTASSLYQ